MRPKVGFAGFGCFSPRVGHCGSAIRSFGFGMTSSCGRRCRPCIRRMRCCFLAVAPMMAGLLLRPHREPSSQSARLGVLDFFLVVLWWLYLYISLIVCWQYRVPNLQAYDRNFDHLSMIENVLLAAVLAVFFLQSSGTWRKFYGAFWIAVVFNGFWFYELNRAIERDVYFTGSWYDVPVFSILCALCSRRFAGRRPGGRSRKTR